VTEVISDTRQVLLSCTLQVFTAHLLGFHERGISHVPVIFPHNQMGLPPLRGFTNVAEIYDQILYR